MTRMRWLSMTLFLVVLPFSQAQGKTNMEKSIEWLCFEADVIVRGKVAKVQSHGKATGKSRDMVSVTLMASETLKTDRTAPKIYHLSVRKYDPKELRTFQERGTELLVFLKRYVQSYSLEGKTYDLWPIRFFHQDYVLIDLSNPGSRLMSATSFQVMKDQAAILKRCREAIRELQTYLKRHQKETITKAQVDIPHQSEAFKVLYEGSACFLFVPSFMATQKK